MNMRDDPTLHLDTN